MMSTNSFPDVCDFAAYGCFEKVLKLILPVVRVYVCVQGTAGSFEPGILMLSVPCNWNQRRWLVVQEGACFLM